MKARGIPVSLLFVLAFLIRLPLAADPLVVKVAAFNYYPGIFRDNDGIIKGFYVDALEAVERKENIRFEYVFGSWSEGLERIKTGEVDIVTSTAYTEERALFMDYCKTPLLTVWGELYTQSSSELDDILEVKGKKVGVMKSDFNAANFIDLVAKFGISCRFVEYPSFEDVFRAIEDGSVDAGVANVIYGAAKQREFKARSTGVVFNPFNIYFTAAKGKNQDILLLLQKYLDEWKHDESSVYNLARQKWTHGSVGAIEVMPGWLSTALLLGAAAGLTALGFIVLLKFQVRSAVAKKVRLEQNFKEMVETLPLAIHLSSGIEQKSEYLNPTMVTLFGYTLEDIPSAAEWWPLAYPDPEYRKTVSEGWSRKVEAAIRTQSSVPPVEAEVTCKDGSKKTISWTFITLGDKNYSCGLDLTEIRAAEVSTLLAEKELLLKEVHHRIKNNMNTIKGLLSMQISAETDPNVVESLKDAESRVQSILTLYDRLYFTDNYRELSIKNYLEPLAREAAGAFARGREIRVDTEVEDFLITVQKLSPIGIIVNELITNMMKHAFIGIDGAAITLTASKSGSRATVSLADNGIGLPESVGFENSPGLGMQLVGMLVEQLDGTIRIERGAGTKFILEFKL